MSGRASALWPIAIVAIQPHSAAVARWIALDALDGVLDTAQICPCGGA